MWYGLDYLYLFIFFNIDHSKLNLYMKKPGLPGFFVPRPERRVER